MLRGHQRRIVTPGKNKKFYLAGARASKQLTSAKRLSGTTLLESAYYGYDKAGNRIQVGAGTTTPTNYDVNNLNQFLSARDHGRTTFSGTVNEAATVKVNGQPAKTMSTDGGAPFRFEGVVDLDAGANTVVVEARDGNNNVSTKSYTVTTAGTTKTYEYDGNGNLRYERLPNATVVREYRWDQQNRLVRTVIGTHDSVYEYDGESRRVRIKELTSSVETKNETFVWCGSHICQKRSSTGSTVVRSYFANGLEESGTTDYFYTRDHLGSVREVVGSNGTTIASRLLYSPWGEVTETGSALSDFAYTGHYYDRPTGLGLTMYRAYDGHVGRWLSQDPIRFAGGETNIYAYVGNDPVNGVDPAGTTIATPAGGIKKPELPSLEPGSNACFADVPLASSYPQRCYEECEARRPSIRAACLNDPTTFHCGANTEACCQKFANGFIKACTDDCLRISH
jgi:RHS repeat-associated protein